jgi:hypothetical protein
VLQRVDLGRAASTRPRPGPVSGIARLPELLDELKRLRAGKRRVSVTWSEGLKQMETCRPSDPLE